MKTNVPVLPIAGAALVRAFLALLSLVTYWLRQLARARRHRREAAMLAGLDNRMLGDIGLTRSDVSDAFSSRFWEDPTSLLQDRAHDRRVYRHGNVAAFMPRRHAAQVEPGFHRPRTDRPARHAI